MRFTESNENELANYVANTMEEFVESIENNFYCYVDPKASDVLRYSKSLKTVLLAHMCIVYDKENIYTVFPSTSNTKYIRVDIIDNSVKTSLITEDEFSNATKELIILSNLKHNDFDKNIRIMTFFSSTNLLYMVSDFVKPDEENVSVFFGLKMILSNIYDKSVCKILLTKSEANNKYFKESVCFPFLHNIIRAYCYYLDSNSGSKLSEINDMIRSDIENIRTHGFLSSSLFIKNFIGFIETAYAIDDDIVETEDVQNIDPLIAENFDNETMDKLDEMAKCGILFRSIPLLIDNELYKMGFNNCSDEVYNILIECINNGCDIIKERSIPPVPKSVMESLRTNGFKFCLVGFGKKDDEYGIYAYADKDHMYLLPDFTDKIGNEIMNKMRVIYDLIVSGYKDFEEKSFDSLLSVWHKMNHDTVISKKLVIDYDKGVTVNDIQNIIDAIYTSIKDSKIFHKKDGYMMSFVEGLVKYSNMSMYDRYSNNAHSIYNHGPNDIYISILTRINKNINSYNLHMYESDNGSWEFEKYHKPFMIFTMGLPEDILFEQLESDTVIYIGTKHGNVSIECNNGIGLTTNAGCKSISEILDTFLLYLVCAIKMYVYGIGNTAKTKKKKLNTNHFRIENPSFDIIINFMEDNKIYDLIDNDGFDKIISAISADKIDSNGKSKSYVVSYDSPNRNKIIRVNKNGELFEVRKSKKQLPFFSQIIIKYGDRTKNGFDLFIHENEYTKSDTFKTDLIKIFNYMRYLKEEEN